MFSIIYMLFCYVHCLRTILPTHEQMRVYIRIENRYFEIYNLNTNYYISVFVNSMKEKEIRYRGSQTLKYRKDMRGIFIYRGNTYNNVNESDPISKYKSMSTSFLYSLQYRKTFPMTDWFAPGYPS